MSHSITHPSSWLSRRRRDTTNPGEVRIDEGDVASIDSTDRPPRLSRSDVSVWAYRFVIVCTHKAKPSANLMLSPKLLLIVIICCLIELLLPKWARGHSRQKLIRPHTVLCVICFCCIFMYDGSMCCGCDGDWGTAASSVL